MHPTVKICSSLNELSQICKKYRNSTVFALTSGCFDLLHGGHIEYLYQAKELGMSLVVGINSDSSVKKLKGDSRPIRKENDRALTIASLYFVDYVIIFNDNIELISAVRPDIYIASSSSRIRVYEDKKRLSLLNKIGADIIETSPIQPSSTTEMIEKISTSIVVSK